MTGQTTTAPPAPSRAKPAVEPSPSGAPDVHTLQSQLASIVEKGEGEFAVGELRPLLEFLRALLNARAVALLPASGSADTASCIVTTRGVLASGVAALVPALDPARAAATAASALAPDAWTLSVPVQREGAPLCWLIAQLSIANTRDVQAFLVLLQTVAGYLLYREQRRAMQQLAWVLERTSGLLDIFRRAGAELDADKASRMAVDELRDYLGCERVYLGVKKRGALRVHAISGIGRVDSKSPLHHPVEAAMREAIEASGTGFQPVAGGAGFQPVGAKELLREHLAAAHITAIPFPKQNGALLLEWKTAPGPLESRLVEAATPFVPVLFDLIQRARPNAALFAARRFWKSASANRRRALLTGTAALVTLLAWPFHYSIKADCRLAPTVKRVIAAPFQGQLRKSLVQPGDRVTEGHPLAEMDNRDLKLKEAELTAARERALKQRDKALTNEGNGADSAAAQLASLEAQSIGRELELVQRKIALLEIKAPLAGIVVSGDLRRAEGQPVQQGQVLFEVAPLEEMIVEIDVPDREISRVRPGLPIAVRLEAHTGARWTSVLDKVHPQSEQREGRNIFVCEAAIGGQPAHDLRPGMRGRATIEGDRRPLAWIIGHRFWEFIVETLFW